MSPTRFVAFTLAAMTALVVLTAALLITVDPYWLWRQAPPWTENGGGENRLLNTQMRFAKALQVVTRQPEIILIGSSRVYRGMDPERLRGPAAQAYNLGLSSMRIHESVAYLRHALRWTRARTVVFGFDFFAFDARVPWENGFDPDLGTFNFVLNAFPIALTNTRAALEMRQPQHDPDGYWKANGFKHSEPRSAETLERLAAEASNLRYDGFVLDETALAALAAVLREARERGLELRLFISPLHEGEWVHIERAGLAPLYAHWQRALYALAAELELTLWDFTAPNPFAGTELSDGSTRYYLDLSHYSPVVGDLILDRLGFELKEPPPELAWSFGRPVNAEPLRSEDADEGSALPPARVPSKARRLSGTGLSQDRLSRDRLSRTRQDRGTKANGEQQQSRGAGAFGRGQCIWASTPGRSCLPAPVREGCGAALLTRRGRPGRCGWKSCGRPSRRSCRR